MNAHDFVNITGLRYNFLHHAARNQSCESFTTCCVPRDTYPTGCWFSVVSEHVSGMRRALVLTSLAVFLI